VTYPDNDYGMVDSLAEAKAWAEQDAEQRTRRGTAAHATKKMPVGRRSARHHATVQRTSAPDMWDVAMDALLERDPKRAADIVRRIREEHGATTKTPDTFKDAMRDVPDAVQRQFSSELLRPRAARDIDVGSRVELPSPYRGEGFTHGIVVKIHQHKALVRLMPAVPSDRKDWFKLADLRVAA
jgi:hypothetical protein